MLEHVDIQDGVEAFFRTDGPDGAVANRKPQAELAPGRRAAHSRNEFRVRFQRQVPGEVVPGENPRGCADARSDVEDPAAHQRPQQG